MAQPKLKKRLSPEARAKQLLTQALDLFGEKGLGRVGHGDIAKRAGVSTATVFHYFPTIEDLNTVVMDAVTHETLTIFEDQTDIISGSSPILIYGARLLVVVERNPNLLKIFLNWSNSYSDPFRARFLTLKRKIISRIAQSLPPREHAHIDAQIIFGTGVLFAQMKVEGASENDLNQFAARVAQLVG